MVRSRIYTGHMEEHRLLRCESFLALEVCVRRLEHLDTRRRIPLTDQTRVEVVAIDPDTYHFAVQAYWPAVVVMTGYLERILPYRTRVIGEVQFRPGVFVAALGGVLVAALLAAHLIHLPDIIALPLVGLWAYRYWLDVQYARDHLLSIVRDAVMY